MKITLCRDTLNNLWNNLAVVVYKCGEHEFTRIPIRIHTGKRMICYSIQQH